MVRGFSFFGVSFVYVVFEDGTDIYWARSRVLEYLNSGTAKLPANSSPRSVPTRPASAGSINTPSSAPNRTLAELRSQQDWYVRFGLAKAQGVAEVASVGGFVQPVQCRRRSGEARSLRRARCRESSMPLRASNLRDRRPSRRAGRGRVHGARPRLSYGQAPTSTRSCSRPTGRRRCCCATSARIELGPDEARRLSRARLSEGEVVGGIAIQRLGAERSSTSSATSRPSSRTSPNRPCPRACESIPRLRSLRADLPRHRDAPVEL